MLSFVRFFSQNFLSRSQSTSFPFPGVEEQALSLRFPLLTLIAHEYEGPSLYALVCHTSGRYGIRRLYEGALLGNRAACSLCTSTHALRVYLGQLCGTHARA